MGRFFGARTLCLAFAGAALVGMLSPLAWAEDAPLPRPPALPPATTPPAATPPDAGTTPPSPDSTTSGMAMPDETYTKACPNYGGGTSRQATRVTVNGQYAFPADLQGDRGTMSLTRALIEVEGTVPVRTRVDLKWGAQFEEDWYDISDPDDIAPGDGRLLDRGTFVRVATGFDTRLGDVWGVALAGSVAWSGAPGAGFEESLTYGAGAVFRRRISPKFGLRLGATVSTQLDGDPFIVPVVSFDGGPETGNVRFGVRGSGGRIGYAFSPRFSAGISARYDSRDWRLGPDDRVPSGVFRDLRIPVGIDAQWLVRSGLMVGFEAGLNVYEEIHVSDKNKDDVAWFEASPSAYIALNMTWVF